MATSVIGAMVKDTRRRSEAKREVLGLLERHGGSSPKAAKAARVARRTFDRWLKELGLLERAAEIRAKMGEKVSAE